MTPEAKARQLIDQKLEQAGWVIQDMKQLNLGAGIGVAVREYPTDTGPAEVWRQEIIDHLEAALASFRDVAAGLAQRG